MRPNTALGFIMAGLSLKLRLPTKERGRGVYAFWRELIGLGCSILVFLLGGLTLIEYFFRWDLHINQLLFIQTTAPDSFGTIAPGRMAFSTALGFVISGLSLILLKVKGQKIQPLAQGLTLVPALLGSMTLIGYAYGATNLIGIVFLATMALHTAVTLIILSIGIVLAAPNHTLVRTILADTVGGVTARRLLPSTIIIPLVLGWLCLQGQKTGLFGTEFGVALLVLSNIITFAVLVWWNARVLNQMDRKRKQAELTVLKAYDDLENRVSERTEELEVANVLLQTEIIERRQAEEALRHSEERYRSLMLATTQIIWTNSADGRMVGEQPSWSIFTGQTYEKYQNFGWSATIHPEDLEHTLACWNRAVLTQSLCEMEHRVCRHDGEYRYCSVRAAPVFNADGSIREWVGAHTDITERKRAEVALRESEQRLAWHSRHDGLTGLINRWEFEQHLEQTLYSAKTHNQQHSLCFLDLDQFKIVNDTCGHAAGDELLRQVTALLQKQVRATDTLARLGGDEFGLLLNQCPLSQSLRIANALRQSLQEFRFSWQDKTFTIGVSIGLVSINADSLDLSNVLSAADMACYAAKNAGRNRVHLYQADDQDLAIRHGQMQWISRLTKALQFNSFCLYYQPIVPLALAESQGKHYEVLLRLQDEPGKLVPPMAFIPAAERYNLMHLIDRWVISTFFASLDQHCQETGSSCLELCCSNMYAINLSGASINDESFIDFLEQQFSLYSVPPQVICFEITETVAITNLSKAGKLISKLKQLGCRFALDDFGSGMSSFAYLKNLPVDYLKIDGEFIKDIVDDPTDLALTQAINQVGHAMGIQTIAEFVENDNILKKITALGIDYAQGYGIAKPQPLQFN